jgi:hypothetical protein
MEWPWPGNSRAKIYRLSTESVEGGNKMKSIKMIGLAAFAVLAAMAFVSVSSAMAEWTQLCKKDQEKCEEANAIKHIHEQTLEGAPAKLLTELGTVECDVLFLGDTLPLGAPQRIHGNFTYTKCKGPFGECTIKEAVQNSSVLEVLKLGHEFADVTYNFGVKLECSTLFKCTYEGKNLRGYGSGPLLSKPEENGGTEIEKQAVRKVGMGICSEEAELDLLMTSLEKVYITE